MIPLVYKMPMGYNLWPACCTDFWFFLFYSAGCQTADPSSPKALRISISREPATLDPRKGGELIGSVLQFMLFEGLTRVNPDGTVTAAQAKRIELSKDRLRYTFYLRDTFWSDGRPVTAYDFAATWKKILVPDFPAPNAFLFYPIRGAEAAKRGTGSLEDVGIHAIDAKTLVVELVNPTPYFLDLVSFAFFARFPNILIQKTLIGHWSQANLFAMAPFARPLGSRMTSWFYKKILVTGNRPKSPSLAFISRSSLMKKRPSDCMNTVSSIF